MEKLTGNVGILTLTNSFSLIIKVNNSGDGVQYQYSGDNEEIHEAEIEYLEDTENITGYADDEDGLLQAGFKTEEGAIYFLGQFMRYEI
jgi:hypothetical protein